mgnify:CR=1 FL=1
MVEAVCTLANNADLKLAVKACLSKTADGSCPDFAVLSTNGEFCYDNVNGGYGGGYGGGENDAIGDWDVSQVKDMSSVFMEQNFFNADVSKWNTSGVIKMEYIFDGALMFNSDVSKWDMSSATDMSGMFQGASKFNGDVSKWDMSSVEQMVGSTYIFLYIICLT